MGQRLNLRWGKGEDIGDDEVAYHLPASFDAARMAYLDAGRFDPNYMARNDPDSWCYLTLPNYNPPWIDRQVGAVKRWLHVD